jgi:hypothetical protein
VEVTIEDPVLTRNEVNSECGEKSEISASRRAILITWSLQGAQ